MEADSRAHSSLADGLRLYRRYLGVSLRSQLQYRASFLLQAIGHLLVTAIEFLGVWALFDRFGSLAGWRLSDVALLYGLVEVSFAIADSASRGFDKFGTMVKNGDFDRLLVRPRSTVLQLLGQDLTLKPMSRLVQGLAVMIWAGQAAGIAWGPAKAVLLLAAIAGAACLFFGLVVLQATSTFWTTETLEIWNAFTYGGNYAAQYPMTIYRPWFRRFFTAVVPIACVIYLPALAILGKHDPLGSAVALQWLGPAAGVLFLVVSLQIWKLGVRRYTSTGS